MKISIITPYRDAAEFLPYCVNSLNIQPGDFEFILVNDGSSDNGTQLVKRYTEIDDRIISVDNDRTPGVSGARNTGIEKATGDYITFLDADDYLLPSAWKVYTRAARIGADIVQFNHKRYYSDKDKLTQKNDTDPGEYNIRRRPRCWPMVWNKMFRRELLEGVRFWPCMQFGEDEIFVLKCLEKSNRIKCVEGATVVHCYNNPDSLSKRVDYKKLFSLVLAIEELLIRSDDPKYKRALCDILAEHWRSDLFKKIFGAG